MYYVPSDYRAMINYSSFTILSCAALYTSLEIIPASKRRWLICSLISLRQSCDNLYSDVDILRAPLIFLQMLSCKSNSNFVYLRKKGNALVSHSETKAFSGAVLFSMTGLNYLSFLGSICLNACLTSSEIGSSSRISRQARIVRCSPPFAVLHLILGVLCK